MQVMKTVPVDLPVEVEFSPEEALNALAAEIHDIALEKGFWEQDENPLIIPTKLALIVDECSEALKVHREDYAGTEKCDCFAPCNGECYDCTNPSEMTVGQAEDFGEELADIIIRTLDLSYHYQIDIGAHISDKITKNRGRPHKHGKRY